MGMEDENNYQLFKLRNKEFTFTVDDSQLGCGLNGALYFVQMQKDGGKSEFGNAGAKYGTGYWTHSARMTSNSSTARPTWLIGSPLRRTQMQAQESMALVALKSIFGKRIPSPQHSPCMPAITRITDARALTVVTMVQIVSRVSATRMAVTCNPLGLPAWTRNCGVQARISKSTPSSQSQ